MAAIEVRGDQWPLLLVSWNAVQTDEDIERYIADSNGYLQRREPFVLLTYMRRYHNEARHRARLAAWMKETSELARKYCVASVMVADSMAFRFALSTLLLLASLPFPYKVCASEIDAEVFLREEAAKRGLRLPARLSFPSARAT